MGKRLPKQELLAEIQVERSRLMDLIDSIPKRKFNLPGINLAQWSIKDVLTHLVAWESRVVGWCQSGMEGRTPEIPGDGFSWGQLKQLNAQIQKNHQRQSIKRVLEEMETVHIQTLEMIELLTNRQLTGMNVFTWTGNRWTTSDYLRANTASHYRWARLKIRRWLATLD